jgi:tRNA pseudouridine55 synthase
MKSDPILFPPQIFNIFKPKGISSFKVVSHWKKHSPKGIGKIGHFGSLDPFATGVILVGISGATKVNDLVQKTLQKTYLAKGKFGIQTDSGDSTGKVLNTMNILDPRMEFLKGIDSQEIGELIRFKFEKDYLQVPSIISACKYKGRPLYDWARKDGVYIEKSPVLRKIFSLEIINYSFPYLEFRVSVSSGTYIRKLFEDISKNFGIYGHLTELTREKIGPFNIQNSLSMESWQHRDGCQKNFDEFSELQSMAPDQLLPFPSFKLHTPLEGKKYANGLPIFREEFLSVNDDESFWVYYSDKLNEYRPKIIGLGKIKNNHLISSVNFPLGIQELQRKEILN